MVKQQTNLIFFQQDLIDDPSGWDGYNSISKSIESRYKTFCFCLDYTFEERLKHAMDDKKKFGFVLKSLKK